MVIPDKKDSVWIVRGEKVLKNVSAVHVLLRIICSLKSCCICKLVVNLDFFLKLLYPFIIIDLFINYQTKCTWQ